MSGGPCGPQVARCSGPLLRAIPLWGLDGDERKKPSHDVLVIGAPVEVHGDRHLIDGLKGDLGHLIGVALAPFKARFARVEVMQGSSASERLEPPCQALVMERESRDIP